MRGLNVQRTEQKPRLIQGDVGSLDASPQAILDFEESQWRSVWHRLEGKYGTPWRGAALSQCDVLPPITSQQIRAAALSFSSSTAVGEDGLHPRAIASLSDEVKSRYAEMLNFA